MSPFSVVGNDGTIKTESSGWRMPGEVEILERFELFEIPIEVAIAEHEVDSPEPVVHRPECVPGQVAVIGPDVGVEETL